MTITTRLLAVIAGACLWAGVARADLDDIRHAAESGDPQAQLELGVLFQFGFHYKDNEIPALTWYTLSANQGNAKAAKLRDALMGKMKPTEIEEAMEQVKQFKPTAAAAPAPSPAATEAPAAEPPPVSPEGATPPPAATPPTAPAESPAPAPSAPPPEAPEPK